MRYDCTYCCCISSLLSDIQTCKRIILHAVYLHAFGYAPVTCWRLWCLSAFFEAKPQSIFDIFPSSNTLRKTFCFCIKRFRNLLANETLTRRQSNDRKTKQKIMQTIKTLIMTSFVNCRFIGSDRSSVACAAECSTTWFIPPSRHSAASGVACSCSILPTTWPPPSQRRRGLTSRREVATIRNRPAANRVSSRSNIPVNQRARRATDPKANQGEAWSDGFLRMMAAAANQVLDWRHNLSMYCTSSFYWSIITRNYRAPGFANVRQRFAAAKTN